MNQFDTPEMTSKAGKLCAALKDRVKGRQYEQIVHVSEIATETDLSEDFVRDAIESDLIRELFGTKGAGWATPEDRGKFIEIPVGNAPALRSFRDDRVCGMRRYRFGVKHTRGICSTAMAWRRNAWKYCAAVDG